MTLCQAWQIAFIYAFACTFNTLESTQYYRLPDFTPHELEQAIQSEESDLIHQFICASLGNCLNRKNPVESFKVALQQLVQEKIKSLDIDFDTNPLNKQPFQTLPVDTKLYLLHALIEWQLQDSQAIRTMIQHQPNPLLPVGKDSKKRLYWQFGNSCWVWREHHQAKSLNEWETVCRSKQELEALVASLSSQHRSEKKLRQWIIDELYGIAEQEEKAQLRKERAALRKAMPVEINITPTQLRSRHRVNYNYDYSESEVDDSYSEPVQKQEIPTRWSSRLARH